MCLGSKKVVQVNHNFRNLIGMHHHMQVRLCPEIEVCIIARIHRTSTLDQPNPNVVWPREVLGFFHVVNVVKPTLVDVVMARQVVK